MPLLTTCLTTALGTDESYAPYPDPPTPEQYYGLLLDPPGQYGCMRYGSTIALTLRGTEEFARRASNLFSSFGGEGVRRYGSTTHTYTAHVKVREGYDADTWLVCVAPDRIRLSLRLYLYGQLMRTKAPWRDIVDSEGDFVESILDNEEQVTLALMKEATRLADSFIAYEIVTDYSVEGLDTIMGAASDSDEYRLSQPQTPDYSEEDEDR